MQQAANVPYLTNVSNVVNGWEPTRKSFFRSLSHRDPGTAMFWWQNSASEKICAPDHGTYLFAKNPCSHVWTKPKKHQLIVWVTGNDHGKLFRQWKRALLTFMILSFPTVIIILRALSRCMCKIWCLTSWKVAIGARLKCKRKSLGWVILFVCARVLHAKTTPAYCDHLFC